MSFSDFWIQQNNSRKERLQAPKEEFGKERLNPKYAHLFEFFDKDKNGKLNAEEMEFLSYGLSAASGDNILTSAESKKSIFSDLGEEKADFLEFVKAISDAVKFSKTEELPNGEKRIITEYKNGITDTIYYYPNGDFKFKITEKQNSQTIDRVVGTTLNNTDSGREMRVEHQIENIDLPPDRFVYLSEQASQEVQLKNFVFQHFIDTNQDAQKAINSVEWLDRAGNVIKEGLEELGLGKNTNNLSKMEEGINANKSKVNNFEQFNGVASSSADLYFGKYEDRFNSVLKHEYIPEKAAAFQELTNQYQTATYLNQCIDLISRALRELDNYETDYYQQQTQMPGDNFNPMSHINTVVETLTQLFDDKELAETMVNQMGVNEKGKFDISDLVEQLKEMLNTNKNKLAETLGDKKYDELKAEYLQEYRSMYNVDTVPEEVLDKVMTSKEIGGIVKIAMIMAIQMIITKQATPVLAAGGTVTEGAAALKNLNAIQKVIQGLIKAHGVQKVSSGINFAVQAGFVPADIGLGLVSGMTSKDGLTEEKMKEIFIGGMYSAKYVGFGYAVTGRMSQAITQGFSKIGLGSRLFNGAQTLAKGQKVIKGADFVSKLNTGVMHYVGKGTAFVADGAAFGMFDALTGDLDLAEATENAFKMQLELGVARHFLETLLGVKVHAKITEAKQKANLRTIDIIEDTNGTKPKYIVQNEGKTLFATEDIDAATTQLTMISQMGIENYTKLQEKSVQISAEGQKILDELNEIIKSGTEKDIERFNQLLDETKQLENPVEVWAISLKIAELVKVSNEGVKEGVESSRPNDAHSEGDIAASELTKESTNTVRLEEQDTESPIIETPELSREELIIGLKKLGINDEDIDKVNFDNPMLSSLVNAIRTLWENVPNIKDIPSEATSMSMVNGLNNPDSYKNEIPFAKYYNSHNFDKLKEVAILEIEDLQNLINYNIPEVYRVAKYFYDVTGEKFDIRRIMGSNHGFSGKDAVFPTNKQLDIAFKMKEAELWNEYNMLGHATEIEPFENADEVIAAIKDLKNKADEQNIELDIEYDLTKNGVESIKKLKAIDEETPINYEELLKLSPALRSIKAPMLLFYLENKNKISDTTFSTIYRRTNISHNTEPKFELLQFFIDNDMLDKTIDNDNLSRALNNVNSTNLKLAKMMFKDGKISNDLINDILGPIKDDKDDWMAGYTIGEDDVQNSSTSGKAQAEFVERLYTDESLNCPPELIRNLVSNYRIEYENIIINGLKEGLLKEYPDLAQYHADCWENIIKRGLLNNTEVLTKSVQNSVDMTEIYARAKDDNILELHKQLTQDALANKDLLKSGLDDITDSEIEGTTRRRDAVHTIDLIGLGNTEAAFPLMLEEFGEFMIEVATLNQKDLSNGNKELLRQKINPQQSQRYQEFNYEITELKKKLNEAVGADNLARIKELQAKKARIDEQIKHLKSSTLADVPKFQQKIKDLQKESKTLGSQAQSIYYQGENAAKVKEIMKDISNKQKELKNFLLENSGIEPQEVVTKLRVLSALAEISTEEEMTAFINMIKPSTPENNAVWDAAVNKKIYQKLGVEYDEALSKKLDLIHCKYISKLFISSNEFFENMKTLVEIVRDNPNLTIEQAIDQMPQNVETKRIFEELGFDYEKFTKADKNSYTTVEIKLNAEEAKQAAIHNLEEDLNDALFQALPKEVTEPIFKHLEMQLGVTFEKSQKDNWSGDGFSAGSTEYYRLYKDGKPITFEDMDDIVSLIKKEVISNDFWTKRHHDPQIDNARGTMYTHLIKMRTQEVDNASSIKEGETAEIEVRKTDMYDIKKALGLGNDAQCCTALGRNFNEWSAPNYIMSKCIGAIELTDKGSFVGNTMIYLAYVDGKPALVLDNIELKTKYQNNDKIRDTFMEYAKKLCDEIGQPDLPIYAGPNRHKLNMDIYPKTEHEMEIIGNSGEQEVYIDYDANGHIVGQGEKTTIEMYEIRSSKTPKSPDKGGKVKTPEGLAKTDNVLIEQAVNENPASVAERKVFQKWVTDGFDKAPQAPLMNTEQIVQISKLIFSGELNKILTEKFSEAEKVFAEILDNHRKDIQSIADRSGDKIDEFASGIADIIRRELSLDSIETPRIIIDKKIDGAAFDWLDGAIHISDKITDKNQVLELISHEFVHLLQYKEILAEYGEMGIIQMISENKDISAEQKKTLIEKVTTSEAFNAELIRNARDAFGPAAAAIRTSQPIVNTYLRRIYKDEFTNNADASDVKAYTSQLTEREAYSIGSEPGRKFGIKPTLKELNETEIAKLKQEHPNLLETHEGVFFLLEETGEVTQVGKRQEMSLEQTVATIKDKESFKEFVLKTYEKEEFSEDLNPLIEAYEKYGDAVTELVGMKEQRLYKAPTPRFRPDQIAEIAEIYSKNRDALKPYIEAIGPDKIYFNGTAPRYLNYDIVELIQLYKEYGQAALDLASKNQMSKASIKDLNFNNIEIEIPRFDISDIGLLLKQREIYSDILEYVDRTQVSGPRKNLRYYSVTEIITLAQAYSFSNEIAAFFKSPDYFEKIKQNTTGKYQKEFLELFAPDKIRADLIAKLVTSGMSEADFLASLRKFSKSTYKLAYDAPNQYLSGIDREYSTPVDGKFPKLPDDVLAIQRHEMDTFFIKNMPQICRALKYLDSDTFNHFMDRRTTNLEKELSRMSQLEDKDFELLSQLIQCKSVTSGRNLSPREKMEMTQIVEIFQQTGLDKTVLIESAKAGEVDIAKVKQIINEAVYKKAGVDINDKNLDPKRKKFNEKYFYLSLLDKSDISELNNLTTQMKSVIHEIKVNEAFRKQAIEASEAQLKMFEEQGFPITKEAREAINNYIDALKNADNYSETQIFDLAMTTIYTQTNTHLKTEELYIVIKEATLGDFNEFINNPSNAYGQANRKTQEIYKNEGLNYEKWMKPDLEEFTFEIGGKKLFIRMWDRNPQEDLFMGNKTTCCTGIGQANAAATPGYLLHTAYNIVQLFDSNGNVVGMSRIYMGKIDGKPHMIMDNIELNNTFTKDMLDIEKADIRDSFFEFVNKYSEQVTGDKDRQVYFYSKDNHVPLDGLPHEEKVTGIIGEIAEEEIYVNAALYSKTNPTGWVKPKELESIGEIDWIAVPKDSKRGSIKSSETATRMKEAQEKLSSAVPNEKTFDIIVDFETADELEAREDLVAGIPDSIIKEFTDLYGNDNERIQQQIDSTVKKMLEACTVDGKVSRELVNKYIEILAKVPDVYDVNSYINRFKCSNGIDKGAMKFFDEYTKGKENYREAYSETKDIIDSCKNKEGAFDKDYYRMLMDFLDGEKLNYKNDLLSTCKNDGELNYELFEKSAALKKFGFTCSQIDDLMKLCSPNPSSYRNKLENFKQELYDKIEDAVNQKIDKEEIHRFLEHCIDKKTGAFDENAYKTLLELRKHVDDKDVTMAAHYLKGCDDIQKACRYIDELRNVYKVSSEQAAPLYQKVCDEIKTENGEKTHIFNPQKYERAIELLTKYNLEAWTATRVLKFCTVDGKFDKKLYDKFIELKEYGLSDALKGIMYRVDGDKELVELLSNAIHRIRDPKSGDGWEYLEIADYEMLDKIKVWYDIYSENLQKLNLDENQTQNYWYDFKQRISQIMGRIEYPNSNGVEFVEHFLKLGIKNVDNILRSAYSRDENGRVDISKFDKDILNAYLNLAKKYKMTDKELNQVQNLTGSYISYGHSQLLKDVLYNISAIDRLLQAGCKLSDMDDLIRSQNLHENLQRQTFDKKFVELFEHALQKGIPSEKIFKIIEYCDSARKDGYYYRPSDAKASDIDISKFNDLVELMSYFDEKNHQWDNFETCLHRFSSCIEYKDEILECLKAGKESSSLARFLDNILRNRTENHYKQVKENMPKIFEVIKTCPKESLEEIANRIYADLFYFDHLEDFTAEELLNKCGFYSQRRTVEDNQDYKRKIVSILKGLDSEEISSEKLLKYTESLMGNINHNTRYKENGELADICPEVLAKMKEIIKSGELDELFLDNFHLELGNNSEIINYNNIIEFCRFFAYDNPKFTGVLDALVKAKKDGLFDSKIMRTFVLKHLADKSSTDGFYSNYQEIIDFYKENKDFILSFDVENDPLAYDTLKAVTEYNTNNRVRDNEGNLIRPESRQLDIQTLNKIVKYMKKLGNPIAFSRIMDSIDLKNVVNFLDKVDLDEYLPEINIMFKSLAEYIHADELYSKLFEPDLSKRHINFILDIQKLQRETIEEHNNKNGLKEGDLHSWSSRHFGQYEDICKYLDMFSHGELSDEVLNKIRFYVESHLSVEENNGALPPYGQLENMVKVFKNRPDKIEEIENQYLSDADRQKNMYFDMLQRISHDKEISDLEWKLTDELTAFKFTTDEYSYYSELTNMFRLNSSKEDIEAKLEVWNTLKSEYKGEHVYAILNILRYTDSNNKDVILSAGKKGAKIYQQKELAGIVGYNKDIILRLINETDKPNFEYVCQVAEVLRGSRYNDNGELVRFAEKLLFSKKTNIPKECHSAIINTVTEQNIDLAEKLCFDEYYKNIDSKQVQPILQYITNKISLEAATKFCEDLGKTVPLELVPEILKKINEYNINIVDKLCFDKKLDFPKDKIPQIANNICYNAELAKYLIENNILKEKFDECIQLLSTTSNEPRRADLAIELLKTNKLTLEEVTNIVGTQYRDKPISASKNITTDVLDIINSGLYEQHPEFKDIRIPINTWRWIIESGIQTEKIPEQLWSCFESYAKTNATMKSIEQHVKLYEDAYARRDLLKTGLDDLTDAEIDSTFTRPAVITALNLIGKGNLEAAFPMMIDGFRDFCHEIYYLAHSLSKENLDVLIEKLTPENTEFYKTNYLELSSLKKQLNEALGNENSAKIKSLQKQKFPVDEKLNSINAQLKTEWETSEEYSQMENAIRDYMEQNGKIDDKTRKQLTTEYRKQWEEKPSVNEKLRQLKELQKESKLLGSQIQSVYYQCENAAQVRDIMKQISIKSKELKEYLQEHSLGLDPQQVVIRMRVLAALNHVSSQNEVKTFIDLIKPPTKENNKAWNDAVHRKVFEKIGIDYDEKLANKLNLIESKYLSQMLVSSSEFYENMRILVDIVKENIDRPIEEILDNLPQNIETRKQFAKLGIDYDKFTKVDKDSYCNVKIVLKADDAKQSAMNNLLKDLNSDNFKKLPKEVTEPIFKSLKEKLGITFEKSKIDNWVGDGMAAGSTEFYRLYKKGKPIIFEDMAGIVHILREEVNKLEFWTKKHPDPDIEAAKADMYTHLVKMRSEEVDNAANIKDGETVDIEIRKTNMYDIKKALGLGNDAQCCTALGRNFNEWSAPTYIMNKCIGAIELTDKGNFVGNTMIYIAYVDGKPALVLDNIELKTKYQNNDKIRDTFVEYAKKLCEEIGQPDLPIYAGPNRHKLNMDIYPKTEHKMEVVGSTADQQVYIDFDAGRHYVGKGEVVNINMYKLR